MLTSASFDAAGSDDALGYPGIDGDHVAEFRLVAIGELGGGGDDEDRVNASGRRQRGRHRAHRAAFLAAVVIGGRRGRIVLHRLVLHRVVIVFAMTGGIRAMPGGVRAVLGARRNRGWQLQSRKRLLPANCRIAIGSSRPKCILARRFAVTLLLFFSELNQ